MPDVEFTVDDIIDKLAKLKLNTQEYHVKLVRLLHAYPLFLICKKNISAGNISL